MHDWDEHPEARKEYLAALAYYAQVAGRGVAERFEAQAEMASDLILQWPGSGSPYRGSPADLRIRTWRLHKFPYNLVYAELDNRILVLAYAHEKRRPGYWIKRLGDT